VASIDRDELVEQLTAARDGSLPVDDKVAKDLAKRQLLEKVCVPSRGGAERAWWRRVRCWQAGRLTHQITA
jgi:hypothetical protein